MKRKQPALLLENGLAVTCAAAGCLGGDRVSTDPIQQAVKLLAATRDRIQVRPLPGRGECVLESPERFAVVSELGVHRRPPLPDDRRESCDRDDLAVDGLDDQVVGRSITKTRVLVGINASLLPGSHFPERVERVIDEFRQVTNHVSRVFSAQGDIASK